MLTFSFPMERLSLLAALSSAFIVVTSGCGGAIEGNGTFTSPNHPGLYPANQRCVWTLMAATGKSAQLHFTSFDLESGIECSYDTVKIYNGPSTSSSLVRSLCGTSLPNDYIGGNVITVMFTSDSSTHKAGFSAQFQSVDSSVATPTVKPGSGCGGDYVSSTGTVSSPNYPNSYPALASCVSTITVQPNYRVVLSFTHVDIESHSTCGYDYLEVRDGGSSGKVLATICGNAYSGAKITSTGSTLYLKFVSDSSLQKTGFLASWQELTCESKAGICVSSNACDGTADRSLPCSKSGEVCCFPKLQQGDCGTIPKSRIIGGNESVPHSWPWQASLQQLSNGYGYHMCGASIITSEWVVTAAHCVDGSSAAILQVVVGEHDLRRPNQEQNFRVQKYIKHEGYHGNNDDGFPNDIALIKVATPIIFNRYVQPVCLPELDEEFAPADNCWITGWGDTKGTGDDNVLNQLKIEVLTREDCRNKWTAQYINDGHICVGNGLKGACNGDSGGPLVCEQNKDGRTRWVVAGATSFGIRGCQTEGFPSVYSRISYFLPWIEATIRENQYYRLE